MHRRAIAYATSVSTGFSLTALWEFVSHVNWPSAVAFAGATLSTAAAWWIAHRAELTRAEIERQHVERQAKRDEDLADLLNRLKIQQAEAAAKMGTRRGQRKILAAVTGPDRPDAT